MESLAAEFGDLAPWLEWSESSQVARIDYTADYRLLLRIFFTVLGVNEKSPRVLRLTESILEINSAHYTVWQHRRECLLALQCSLPEELQLMDIICESNPKNYQIWYHRRAVLERINEIEFAKSELSFIESVLDEDSKNYHAWAYRQWILSHFQDLEDEIEMELIDRLLIDDVRNNSAWNHRWFIVFHRSLSKTAKEEEEDFEVKLSGEIVYTFEKIRFVKNNESAWNYLTGILTTYPQSLPSIQQGYSPLFLASVSIHVKLTICMYFLL